MFAEFMSIALAVCLLLGTCPEAYLAYETSIDTLLEAAFLEYISNMDYMGRSAHQKRAPKTFSWPLVALWSHYSQRHKSLF